MTGRVEGRTGWLAWSVSGDGSRDLLLIHALGSSAEMWAPQLPALSSLRSVVLVELAGHGDSTAAPGPYTIDDLCNDILSVADAAGTERFDLVGMSLGGLVALWLAAHNPDRVLSLIASNTAARIGSVESWSERIGAVEAGGLEAISEQVLGRFFTAAADPKLVDEARRALLAVDPVGYVGCCAALRDADLRHEVGTIRCPTLIIGGGADVSTPPAESFWLGEHIPGSRAHILEGAPHLSNLERPDAWTEAATGFLRSL